MLSGKRHIAVRCLGLLTAVGLVMGCMQPGGHLSVGATADPDSLFYIETTDSYDSYLALNAEAGNGVETVDCHLENGGNAAEYDGKTAIVVAQDATAEFSLEVQKNGFYNLSLPYYPDPDESGAVEFSLKFDGSYPFDECMSLSLSRSWKSEEGEAYDTQGNQIRPNPVADLYWSQSQLLNPAGDGELQFYLAAGRHTLTLTALQGRLILEEPAFTAPQSPANYADVLAVWEQAGYAEATSSLELIQAESASGRSDKSIALNNDRTSAATTPYHSYQVRYNTIGGGSWATPGQWIEWQVDVPESALYTIVLRYKQDTKTGGASSRALMIDGAFPFAEAANLNFSYDGSWQTAALGNGGETYKFYLEKGVHTIRMYAVLGSSADVIQQAQALLDRLNQAYIEIVMITGTSPDTNRDYGMKRLIPELIEEFAILSGGLRSLEQQIEETFGNVAGNAEFERLYVQLDRMHSDPETIPKRLSDFQSNITALGTWINSSRSQPLTLDYLIVSSPSDDLPRAEKGFFATVLHHVSQFLSSFSIDYSAIGNAGTDGGSEIVVWLSTGRDQADIIRKMVNSGFTPESGINVKLQLVTAGTLLPAILAKIGPDVSLNMTETEPVNYALRNAVVDLSQLDGAEEVLGRFHEAALIPFELDGGVYALPETMEYPMLFYRKDILDSIGIKDQDLLTWNDILQKVLPELELSYFDFGFLPDVKHFATLLYQNGGDFYNAEHTESALHTPNAYTAFSLMTRLYTDYEIPLSFDFVNRFRSGQMPLAVSSYTAYNQLSVFAPEIDGLWGMTVLPGVRDENGNINHIGTVTVTGAIILKQTKHPDEAWSFLKWWMQDDIQSEYASELETVMGTAARYATANIGAAKTVGWSASIRAGLERQREQLTGMPQIAGSYYTTRYFDFALRDVVNNGENVRESLLAADESISGEIAEKRAEFYGKQEDGQ